MSTRLCNIYLSKTLSSYLVWVLEKKHKKSWVCHELRHWVHYCTRLYWAQNCTAYFLPALELPEELCVQLCVCRNLWCRQTLSNTTYKTWDYWCKLTNSGTVTQGALSLLEELWLEAIGLHKIQSYQNWSGVSKFKQKCCNRYSSYRKCVAISWHTLARYVSFLIRAGSANKCFLDVLSESSVYFRGIFKISVCPPERCKIIISSRTEKTVSEFMLCFIGHVLSELCVECSIVKSKSRCSFRLKAQAESFLCLCFNHNSAIITDQGKIWPADLKKNTMARQRHLSLFDSLCHV